MTRRIRPTESSVCANVARTWSATRPAIDGPRSTPATTSGALDAVIASAIARRLPLEILRIVAGGHGPHDVARQHPVRP